MWKVSRFLLVGITLAPLGITSAWAGDGDLVMREPKHWALVITNDDYQNLDKLPSAIADSKGMFDALNQAHFDVTTASNLRNYSDFDKVLRDFARKVDEDDLVVVYFSGHGFIYAGSSYIVGTTMPQPMSKGDILKSALASETIPDYFNIAKPGGVVLLIDACRSLGAIKTDPQSVEVNKGSQTQLSQKSHFFMGLATKDGATAAGYEQKEVMSLYTSAIVSYIAKQDAEFKDVYQDIGVKVLLNSTQQGAPQEPGVYGYWYEKIYMNPTQKTYDGDKEAWLSALNEKKAETVKVFIARYALSPYVRAAKAWLDKNGDEETAQAYTGVSPRDVETAFNAATQDEQAEVNRSLSSLGFDRIQNYQGGLLEDALPHETSTNVPISAESRIVLKNFNVRAAPGLNSKVVGKLASMDRVLVKDYITNGSDTWAKIGAPKLGGNDAYIKVNPTPSDQKIVLGRPIGDFVIPTSTESSSLVSGSAIDDMINQLKQSGKTITWISLSAGATEDPALASDRLLQLANAKYLLTQQGISSKAITSVAASPEVTGNGVRMKVLGY